VGHPRPFVAVDTLRTVVLERRANQCGVAVAAQCEAVAEPVARMNRRRLDVRLLHPRRSAAGENICRTAGGVGRLIVTADRGASLHDSHAETILVERSN